MEKNLTANTAIKPDWYSVEFVYNSVVNFLKENAYKIHKENPQKEAVNA